MPIKRILFPTDFKAITFNSLEPLFVLKKAGLKEVILCHVIARDKVGFVPKGGFLKEEAENMREEARIRFHDWQNSLSDEGIGSKLVIVVGEPIPKILKIAEEENVDLIVVGKIKKGAIKHIITGSHTLQIVSRSKVPVLLSKYMMPFRLNVTAQPKINECFFEMPLLAVDWSEQSQRAFEFLMSLEGAVNKALVFHNINIKTCNEQDKSELCRIEKESETRLADYCNRLKSIGIEAEPHLGAGDVVPEILRVSLERNASMIITGNAVKGLLHETVSGSVSYQLAKMSELPTLLVP